MTETPEILEGGCLCGAVRYRITAPFRPVIACHCRQCARWSGHVVAATAVALTRFAYLSGDDDDVTWYAASPHAERGFCGRCGSNLFWRETAADHLSIMAGTLDQPTGLMLGANIYVADKSDYYQINDDLPAFEAGSAGDQGLVKP